MGYILSISKRQGGVGKTVTAVTLSLSLLAHSLAACGSTTMAVHPVESSDAPRRSVPTRAAMPKEAHELRALAAELSNRGRVALGHGNAAFSRPGNVAVSFAGTGLALAAGDALFGSRDSARFEPLIAGAFACFSWTHFSHEIMVARDVPIDRTSETALFKLTPGMHRGETEPPEAERCGAAYAPITRAPSPSTRLLYRPSLLEEKATPVEGKRVARAKSATTLQFRGATKHWVGFGACGEKDDPFDLSTAAVVRSSRPPDGIAFDARVYVAKSDEETLVAVPVIASPERSKLARTLVLVLPKDSCRMHLSFDPARLARVRQAATAARTVDVRVLLPSIRTYSDIAASSPAPFDALHVSTRVNAYATVEGKLPKRDVKTTIVFSRPFLYMLFDDATSAELLMGRFEKLDPRMETIDLAHETGNHRRAPDHRDSWYLHGFH